jgi:photosystem II stability/assembly factor-like uncharacterized protein
VEPGIAATHLRAIACRGDTDAWVVGDGGTVLRSADGGISWNRVDAETPAPLTAVVASESARVWAAGEGGVLMSSSDGGEPFEIVAAGILDDITGLATDHTGERVWLTTAAGSVWHYRFADATAVEALRTPTPLRDVDVATLGGSVVAVGDAGSMWRSIDEGSEWIAIDLALEADLNAVQIARDGLTSFAVGDSGALVRIIDDSVELQTITSADLRALHLHADGAGAVVGDGGGLFVTHDAARTFEQIATGTTADLFGLDAIGRAHL